MGQGKRPNYTPKFHSIKMTDFYFFSSKNAEEDTVCTLRITLKEGGDCGQCYQFCYVGKLQKNILLGVAIFQTAFESASIDDANTFQD